MPGTPTNGSPPWPAGPAGPAFGPSGEPGAPPPPRGSLIPARAAWWALAGFALAEVLAGLLAAIGQAITGTNSQSLLEVFSEPGLWAGMFLTVVLVSRHFGTGNLSRDFGLSGKAIDLGWGAIAFITMLIMASAVVGAFSGTKYAGSNTEILSSQKDNGLHYAVVAVVVAVGAPFFEELFFRGFLRTALTTRFGAHGGIFAQAALFGAAHAGEVKGYANVSVVLAMFTLGVVLGYTAKLTGRLGAGMVAHCLFNLAAVISLA